MSLTRTDAAHILGMKDREIASLSRHTDGTVVTTHDGTETLVRFDATFGPVPAAEKPAGADDGSTSGDQVPAGSMEKVLAWVGDDAERARVAIEAEQGRDKPRTSLLAELERVAASDA